MIDIILLQTLGLKKNAAIADVREAYLQLTTQIKFHRVLLSEERLRQEFTKYHEAYVSLLHQYEDEGLGTDDTYYPPDRIATFLFNSGIYHLIKENYIKAGEKLQQAYNTNNKNILTNIYLGILLMMRKRNFPAEKYFSDALKIDPDNEDACFYAAENYTRAGKHKQALDMYYRVKKINPVRKDIDTKIRETAKKSGIKIKGQPGSGQQLLRKISSIFNK